MLPNCWRWGMEFYAWAPLAQGLLAGRYTSGTLNLPPDSRAEVIGGIYRERVSNIRAREAAAQFVSLCHRHGLDPAAAALAWTMRRPGVTGTVFGPRTSAHVVAASSAPDISPGDQFSTAVDQINPPGSACVSFFNSAPWMLERIA
jgi:aryl-alcohol dehydrogenase-like predicted oxidoreductase